MFGASMAGANTFFNEDGTSTLTERGWVKGVTWLVDLYKNGYAPKDSVNWGFNEIVAGFYSGTCAMLDQDPDALIAIAERMKPEDYGVMTMPEGPGRQGLPDHRLCRLVDVRRQPEQGPLLEADRDARRAGGQRRVEQADRRAADPQVGREGSLLCRAKFKGWFDELADKDVRADRHADLPARSSPSSRIRMVVKTSQQALLGDITPEEMAKQWADYLTKAQQKFLAKK